MHICHANCFNIRFTNALLPRRQHCGARCNETCNIMPTRPLWIWTFSFLIFKFLFEIGAKRLNLIKVVCSSCGTRHGSSKPLPVWQLSWTSFAWLCLIYYFYKLADYSRQKDFFLGHFMKISVKRVLNIAKRLKMYLVYFIYL